MNICIFSIVNYWHGVKGGMEIHGKILSKGLVTRGHQVSILTTRHPNDIEFEEKSGVKIYYLKNTVFGSWRNNWEKASISKFHQLNKEEHFDIICSQSFAAYGLASINETDFNIPIISILHGSIRQQIITFKSNILVDYLKPMVVLKSFLGLILSYFVMQKPLLSISTQIITVSRELIDDLKTWYGSSIASKAITIFNGIDTMHFCPNQEYRKSIREKYGIKENEILLMASGALTREKGHHFTIDALAKIKAKNKNLKLMIIGKGEYQRTLKKITHDLALENDVIFTGFIENKETPKYYNCADIFIMPTLRVEGLPLVLLETMSCGRPTIASRIGGITSVIKDGKNGLLIKPGNTEELIKKIQNIINDSYLLNRLSVSARRTILYHFNADKMIDTTINLMEEVIKRKQ